MCARGRRETAHAQIWEQQGTGMSRGRWDVDKKKGEYSGEDKSFYMERSLRGE